MSSRLKLWGACRTLAIRARPVAPRTEPFATSIRRPRWYSSDNTTQQPPNPIENSNKTAGSSEAAAVSAEGDAVTEKASEANASEVAEADTSSEALDDATLEQLFFGGRRADAPSQTEGGLTPAQEDILYREGTIPSPDVAEALSAAAEAAEAASHTEVVEAPTEVEKPGHKFAMPQFESKEGIHLKKRYHPVLEQITRLLMRDGKLSVAQRNMAIVMNFLRTSPSPIYSPKFPLLPGTPPAAYLPLNPILYITVAIDSVAPLIKVRNISGGGGGGRALELPMPLELRQRRRVAFKWIMDVVTKKPSKGSGRNQFAYRLAEEIIAVVEGRSSVWDKRKLVHKLGTAARANVGNKRRMKKKK